MLILSRKRGEAVNVDGPCVVKVLGVKGEYVKLGIEAAAEVGIRRGELEPHSATGAEDSPDEPDRKDAA